MDLRGLAAVAGRILQILSLDADAAPDKEHQALELYGISRFFGRRSHHAQARRYCECALEMGLPSAIVGQARQELARFSKRELRERRRSQTR